MDIYTFGDPELIREALLALATIFSLTEWSDAGSALGLGGNMLAVALIGLIGVGIAGITSQQVRVDYLFVALVIFGILFSAKVTVNVEDIQSGDAYVVAGVPVGIAAVASMSSAAAKRLTETTSLALQRPGSETSVLTAGGFLDPLRVLLSLRNMHVQSIDTHLSKSILEYFRMCVGRTRVTNPGVFDMNDFLLDPDPLGYMLNDANVMNFTFTLFNDANPGGVATACQVGNDVIQARMDEVSAGTTPEVEIYLQRAMGSEQYNTAFEHADVTASVDLLTRGGIDAQDFISNLFLKNMYNQAEALSEAEYGTNATQYVATVTEAFESQRFGVATEGTVFLQMMFPLMSFFQFLFFALAPFAALVMIASPFTASKTIGGYLLFGVWSYSWLPIAAVINHYIQITTQNELLFSNIVAAGTDYTSILAFDDLYNILATKVVIGSNALASVPAITGLVLGGTLFGMSNLSRGFSQAGNSNRVNTSLGAPGLAHNSPIAGIGGRSSVPTGTVMGRFGGAGASSGEQKDAYKQLQFRSAASTVSSAGNSMMSRATQSYGSSVSSGVGSLNQTLSEGGFGSTIKETYDSAARASVSNAFKGTDLYDKAKSLSSSEVNALTSTLGIHTPFGGAGESTGTSTTSSDDFKRMQGIVKDKGASIAADLAEGVAASSDSSASQKGSLRQTADTLRGSQESYDSAKEFQSSASEMANNSSEIARVSQMDTTDIAGAGIRRYGSGTQAKLDALFGSYGSGFLNDVKTGGDAIFNRKRPIGLDGLQGADGRGDTRQDRIDTVASQLLYLSDKASSDATAAHALLSASNLLAGVGDPSSVSGKESLISGLKNVDGKLNEGKSIQGEVDTQFGAAGENQQFGAIVDESSSLINDGGNQLNPISEANRSQVNSQFSRGKGNVSAGSALGGLAPGLSGQHSAARDRFGAALAGVASEGETASGSLSNWLKPGVGFNDVLENELSTLANLDPKQVSGDVIDRNSDNAVNKLQGAISKQFHAGMDIEPIYQKYQDAGFTKRQAAFATYGEVGGRTPGASDLMMAGLATVAGAGSAKLMGKSPLVGGAVGVALFAAGVGVAAASGESNAKEAESRVAEMLKADFISAAGGEQAGYAEFSRRVDSAQGIQGMLDVASDYDDSGKLR